MEKIHHLEEYDVLKLKEAKTKIQKIYEYHYGDSYMRKELNRLETILNKIDFLITEAEKANSIFNN